MSDYTPVSEKALHGGIQRIYSFDNGWAASVIKGPYTYGGPEGFWELAVLEGVAGDISYDTPLTDDVIGWLTDEELENTLAAIAELDPL